MMHKRRNAVLCILKEKAVLLTDNFSMFVRS